MQHIAIGRRGQNVRLASQLTGWEIDIVSETEESERRTREFNRLTELFVNALNCDEVIAQLLATEGFGSVEQLAAADVEDLASIQGFDEEVALALKERAESFLQEQEETLRAEAAELQIADDLLGFDRIDLATAVALGRKGVKTLEDLADLAGDELVELAPEAVSDEIMAGEVILDARRRLGWIEEEPEGESEAEMAADEGEEVERA
jgi:N utilization substance protein A